MEPDSDVAIVEAPWIRGMVILGGLGLIVGGIILVFGSINYYPHLCTEKPFVANAEPNNNSPNGEKKNQSKNEQYLIVLTIALWICNFIACLFWTFFRSDYIAFYDFTPAYCRWVYILNFLFYLFGKYFLHILLVYRIYFTFKESNFEMNLRFFQCLFAFITANFITATIIWIATVHSRIQVGLTTDGWHICTLYNSASRVDWSAKIYPIYFGAQDLIVSTITLWIFLKKIYAISHSVNEERSRIIYPMMKKLCILGVIAILSTFCFYTFAVPFYPDFTFLIAADTIVNSLSVLLIAKFSNWLYILLCCACDRMVANIFEKSFEKSKIGNDRSAESAADVTDNNNDGCDIKYSGNNDNADEKENIENIAKLKELKAAKQLKNRQNAAGGENDSIALDSSRTHSQHSTVVPMKRLMRPQYVAGKQLSNDSIQLSKLSATNDTQSMIANQLPQLGKPPLPVIGDDTVPMTSVDSNAQSMSVGLALEEPKLRTYAFNPNTDTITATITKPSHNNTSSALNSFDYHPTIPTVAEPTFDSNFDPLHPQF